MRQDPMQLTAFPGIEEDIETTNEVGHDDLAKVIIHNDDVTPMNFVVSILLEIFKRPLIFAEAIMLEAHHKGQAVVVALPQDEAESKVRIAHMLARTNGYPLTFTIEQDE